LIERPVRLCFGGWTVDLGARLVVDAAGTPVHLTPKAFDLLAILIERAPNVVRKADLHAQLWPDCFVSDATLAGMVKELRRAFRDQAGSCIRTSHGVGYAFVAPLDHVALDHLTRAGPDRWLINRGRRHPLNLGRNVIGRDLDCDICLADAGVSRHHAEIIVSADGAILQDLGSKNGTRLR
jgi:DNA-binding winged helix-turn-helix (wHTH) protein